MNTTSGISFKLSHVIVGGGIIQGHFDSQSGHNSAMVGEERQLGARFRKIVVYRCLSVIIVITTI